MISEYHKKIIDKKRNQILHGIHVVFYAKYKNKKSIRYYVYSNCPRLVFNSLTVLEYMLEMLKGISFTCHDTRGLFYDIDKGNQISLDEFKKRVEKLNPNNYRLVLHTSKDVAPYHPYIAIDNGPNHLVVERLDHPIPTDS